MDARPLSPTVHTGYFSGGLADIDPEIAHAIDAELGRQREVVELIASENIVSKAVLEALGTVLANKTVEGYPGRRFHSGAEYADLIERAAIERACRLFGCRFANVQPHSGSQANTAIFLATLRPGDTVLSMDLKAGGHLSHGAPANLTGKWFNVVSYTVRRDDGLIDYEEMERLAEAHRPRLIIAGGSSYARIIDFARFRRTAKAVGARLLVDMAHFAGLVAGGVHPSPIPHADIVMTTTYKSLRGARGAIILSNDEAVAKAVNAAVFPGVQGTPLLHMLAGKAVCLGEALRPEFRGYAQSVLENARTLAAVLAERGWDVVTGGTDTPLFLLDLRSRGLKGNLAADSLERAGIACNKNNVPYDPEGPDVTSGLRFGASAGTTRGFGTVEFRTIGDWIADVLEHLAEHPEDNAASERKVLEQVRELTRRFPIYPSLA